ncbi:PLP-dependent aminotransferase family protein [Streptomyces viridochromogenes]|uniref:aminotransferase-like domain-containing protein n=1 Tax=Streptomyces viridochromogenes TaxID=1938 RepID=UPI0031E04F75
MTTTVPPLAARAAAEGSTAVAEILALTARPEVISFAGGLPAPELFDAEGIAEAFQHVLTHSPRRALQYSTPQGDPVLRVCIADRLTARGLATAAGDLAVTTGAQQGLSLLVTALLEPGDSVVVEDPCYLAALQAFRLAGIRIVPVHCDEEGIDPDELARVVAAERPKLLYMVPTFQNPTGRILPSDRRAAVAGVAARYGLWIVEDDPYGELLYEGEPTPWLAGYRGAEDRTALLGSFSKIFAPGLRLGWLRAPAEVRSACVRVKQVSDVHSSTVDQAAAAHYMATADLDARIALLRTAYRARRDALLEGLADVLPDGSRWNRPRGGMFVWSTLPPGYDATEVLYRAMRHDVAFVPGAPFFVGSADPGALRLSFVTHSPEEILEGTRRLARAF